MPMPDIPDTLRLEGRFDENDVGYVACMATVAREGFPHRFERVIATLTVPELALQYKILAVRETEEDQ